MAALSKVLTALNSSYRTYCLQPTAYYSIRTETAEQQLLHIDGLILPTAGDRNSAQFLKHIIKIVSGSNCSCSDSISISSRSSSAWQGTHNLSLSGSNLLRRYHSIQNQKPFSDPSVSRPPLKQAAAAVRQQQEAGQALSQLCLGTTASWTMSLRSHKRTLMGRSSIEVGRCWQQLQHQRSSSFRSNSRC